jgi:hypothetical protein
MMEQFIVPIAAFAGLLIAGVLSGGLVYVTTYFQKSQQSHNDVQAWRRVQHKNEKSCMHACRTTRLAILLT